MPFRDRMAGGTGARQPGLFRGGRPGGAEEALRLLWAKTDEALSRHDPLCQDLEAQAAELHGRVSGQLQQMQGFTGWWKRKAAASADLIASLRAYAKTKFQVLMLR